jgi:hypothetical protein
MCTARSHLNPQNGTRLQVPITQRDRSRDCSPSAPTITRVSRSPHRHPHPARAVGPYLIVLSPTHPTPPNRTGSLQPAPILIECAAKRAFAQRPPPAALTQRQERAAATATAAALASVARELAATSAAVECDGLIASAAASGPYAARCPHCSACGRWDDSRASAEQVRVGTRPNRHGCAGVEMCVAIEPATVH